MSRFLLTITLIGIPLEELQSALGGEIHGNPVVQYLWNDGIVRPMPVESLPTGTEIQGVAHENSQGWQEDQYWLAVPFGFQVPEGIWPSTWGLFHEEEWDVFKGQGIWIWEDDEWEPF